MFSVVIKNTVFIGFTFGVSGSLSSCDPGVRYDKVIQNDSDHDLILTIYPDSVSRFYTMYDSTIVRIPKHSEVSIAGITRLGQKREFQDCSTYADSIRCKVMNNDCVTLTKNVGDKSNWTFKVLQDDWGDGGICECRCIIN